MDKSSETQEFPYKKHPAEDFYRETRDVRASLLASMPKLISIPSTASRRSPKIEQQSDQEENEK